MFFMTYTAVTQLVSNIYAFNVIFKDFWHRWLCKTEIMTQLLDNDIYSQL